MPTRDEQRLLDNLNRTHAPGMGGAVAACVVFLRLFLGFAFLRIGWNSLANLGNPAPLRAQVVAWIADQAHPFWGYQEFLRAVVLPHIGLFHALVILGQVTIGVLLLLGALTRLAAFGALFLCVNYWFALGCSAPAATGQAEALAAIALVVIVTGAGRLLGIDALLARRFPRAPFW